MECSILDMREDSSSNAALLADKEVSLQDGTHDSDKEDNDASPSHHMLLSDSTVLLQTDEGYLLSVSEDIGGITYQPFNPTDLQEGGNYSLIVNTANSKTSLVQPPHASDFDTRALDKFPDLSGASLTFSDPAITNCSASGLSVNVLQDKEMVSLLKPQNILCFNLEPPNPNTDCSPVREAPKKQRGGWTKGKKRKLVDKKPRIPSTAFVIFSQQRRVEIKQANPSLVFTEISKILGKEWSLMKQQDKQKYIDESAADRQRYLSELQHYQQTDEYKNFLKSKNLNSIAGIMETNGATNSEVDYGTDDLHCALCDQHFSSHHNKREHMYGSKHVQAMEDEVKKSARAAENSLCQCTCSQHKEKDTNFLDFQYFSAKFYENNFDRELEIHQLTKLRKTRYDQYSTNLRRYEELKKEFMRLEEAVSNMKSASHTLATHINSLKMVPMLFDFSTFSNSIL